MHYDLRAFFAALGGRGALRAGLSADERHDTQSTVEVYDDTHAPVRAEPLVVSGYVDGVQASACVAYRDHRPIHLVYVGAARLAPSLSPLAVSERLTVVCGRDDVDEIGELSQGLPIHSLDSADPPELEQRAREYVDQTRRVCERDVITGVTDPVVVDGDLRGRLGSDSLAGVAKTLRTRYLPDEASLVTLPAGWRSERFKISGSNEAARYSCYVRLLDADSQSWSYGLVRLETYRPEWLEPLAALCLQQRQGARSGDARYDTHLAPIRACEELLRARRPAAFAYL